ncbi:rpl27 (nucleomorph) [Hemiselmis andersenii]|uniref:Rpl27 n=1 Tax=Hemiselmis andersenii TaxID=464988 RepID=A9BL49_HEMAN|nr:rpl27 [Hemiselmis andersenii]ABW98232.1 rpl27 [Hemiselmis andersenii]|mmetsp:Transcript_21720/g.50393  ORF Transcript_21720/g.50393 Transcript_21720/m.50393 type:complete len:151 (-) Transcript_21720:3031-3483(-)
MKTCFKNGRVVLILRGRFAGSKAIILTKSSDFDQNSVQTFILAGIQKYPQLVTRKMSLKKISKKSRMKIFIKKINMNHVFPTRFFIDLNKTTDKLVNEKIEDFRDFIGKKIENKEIFSKEKQVFSSFLKNIFLDQFFSGKQKWFFKKLRF